MPPQEEEDSEEEDTIIEADQELEETCKEDTEGE